MRGPGARRAKGMMMALAAAHCCARPAPPTGLSAKAGRDGRQAEGILDGGSLAGNDRWHSARGGRRL